MRIDPGPEAPPPRQEAPDVSHEVMTAVEVSRALRVPLRTVYDLADKGEIAHFRVGRRRQFLRETIEAIKAQGKPAQPLDL